MISFCFFFSDKLYFATLENNYRPVSTKFSKYFHIEDEIVYENFYFDYGPYHLCHLYYFCMKLNDKLAAATKSVKIVFYTSDNKILRLNAAYLMGSYCVSCILLLLLSQLLIKYYNFTIDLISFLDYISENVS